ncbi:MAG: hypothetical protein GY928_30825 [Colwellia sp.]|nr:hypothetical protein [Colwellia sp.]
MSEDTVISKEQAIWFGKLQNREIDIVDEVWLESTNRLTSEVKVTGPYERIMLDQWVVRVRRENSGFAMVWRVLEKGEDSE